jgi:SulP family sulfate permease
MEFAMISARRLQPFFPFLRWWPSVTPGALRADLIAGIIGAFIVLPQGVAFATLAGMPPQYGLYAAMVPAVIAALWGSSRHLVSGPTNAISLVVFATVSQFAEPGSPHYVAEVLTLAFMVGVMQLSMGLFKLGTLVNFISHTVVVGFTAGAALLIIASQIKSFFGLPIPRGVSFFETLHQFALLIGQIQPWVVTVGLITLASGLLAKRLIPKVPYMIVAMLVGSLAGVFINAEFGGAAATGIKTLGALSGGLPQLSTPEFKLDTLRQLLGAAVAVTVLGLTEAVSIARSIATKSGQRIDGNQEFIGQGLSNIVGSFFSAYPSSGSFNRSGVNYEAGAQTPLAAVLSAAALILILMLVAPLAAYLPLAAMAGILFLVAWGLIDFHHIGEIWKVSKSESAVLGATFISTLVLHLEFAVLVGIIFSLMLYLSRTARPGLRSLIPNPTHPQRRLMEREAGGPECPQLKMLRIDGSLYFGAVSHVAEYFHYLAERQAGQKHLLLVANHINFVDIAGADVLATEAARRRKLGGGLYFQALRGDAQKTLGNPVYSDRLGPVINFPRKTMAIAALVPKLDGKVCTNCKARIFKECAAMPDASRG